MASSKPKFGDIVTNHLAGRGNPGRVGFFVRAGHIPRGRMNAGPYWEVTDGHGKFWKTRPSDTLTFEPAAAPSPAVDREQLAVFVANAISRSAQQHVPVGYRVADALLARYDIRERGETT